jgi:hypothetical protein
MVDPTAHSPVPHRAGVAATDRTAENTGREYMIN